MKHLRLLGILALSLGLLACSSKQAESETVVQEVPQIHPVDEAIAMVNKLDYNGAIAYATNEIAQNGESVEMLTIRGIAYAKNNQGYKAFADLNEAVKMEYSAYTLYNLGTALRMFGFCARAADAFEKAQALDPDNTGIQISLVSTYTCYGDLEHANAVFVKLLSNFPQDPVAFTNAGILKSMNGEFEEAKQAAQKAISIDAFYKPGYRMLRTACNNLGDTACANQADAEYKKLVGKNFKTKPGAKRRQG